MAQVTVSDAQRDIEALKDELAKDQGWEVKKYPVTSNWASQLGHECERYLVHNRLDWEQRKPKDWKGMGERGNIIHEWWKRRMSEKGYTVIQGEMPLSQALRTQYNIGGKIDGRIGKNARPMLYEFKTMNEHDYHKINSVHDITESHKNYVKMYVAQLMVYLYDNNEEAGLFILCNTTTLEWKAIEVYLDSGYCEWLLQRAERVNRHVANTTYPDRIGYGKTCQGCDYANVCLPDIRNEGLELRDDEHLMELLKEAGPLAPISKRYEELMDEAKDIAKMVGRDFIVGNAYKAELKKSMMRRVDTKAIPPEIRSQYEKETEVVKVAFVPLNEA